jgi:hypothetical protein
VELVVPEKHTQGYHLQKQEKQQVTEPGNKKKNVTHYIISSQKDTASNSSGQCLCHAPHFSTDLLLREPEV